MPRRATFLTAAGVILAGLVGAMLFRRDPAPAPQATAPTADSEVVVRRHPVTAKPAVPASTQLTAQVEPRQQTLSTTQQTAHSSFSIPRDGALNPHSAAAWHNPFSAAPAQTGGQASPPTTGSSAFTPPPIVASPAATPPFAPPPASTPERVHVVVDGDTLSDLAELYLGAAHRYGEIFDANRNALSHPDLLPIGARLKIPGDAAVRVLSGNDEKDLVPIPRNAWRRGRSQQP
jgi:nucleoid-associated protein YgaU